MTTHLPTYGPYGPLGSPSPTKTHYADLKEAENRACKEATLINSGTRAQVLCLLAFTQEESGLF